MEVHDDILSLVTISLYMNTTTMNQGDHCIITYNDIRPAVNLGNQSLTSTASRCASLERSLAPALQALANIFFSQNALSGLRGEVKA